MLQTALERRGVRTLAAGRTETGLELARRHHPDLIVLDLDDYAGLPVPAEQTLACPGRPQQCRAEPHYQPRLVLLGNSPRLAIELLPEGEFVPKPYHYGPLIRKIEELLASADRSREARAVPTLFVIRGTDQGSRFELTEPTRPARARCVEHHPDPRHRGLPPSRRNPPRRRRLRHLRPEQLQRHVRQRPADPPAHAWPAATRCRSAAR